MFDIQKTKDFCESVGCRFAENVPMSEYTTFRIGGPADIACFPDTEEKLCSLVGYAVSNDVEYTLIGKGSNVLVSDQGIRGMVIITSSLEGVYFTGENTVTCLAGTPLIRLCQFALENALSGLEFAYGIPGSAGGAAYMNAGAYGGEMKDILVSCSHIDKNGRRGSLSGEELALAYRHSAYSDNGFVITSVTVRLVPSTRDEIKAKMEDLLSRRKAKQPLDYPSAGSTFKRPEGYFAGALIEQCGLKGYSIGGAQVSEKHAGFVINKGSATAADVLGLVNYIKANVLENTGVFLEPEIRFIG